MCQKILKGKLLSFPELLNKYSETFSKIEKHYEICYKKKFYVSEIGLASNFKIWCERFLNVDIIYELNPITKRVDLFILRDGEYLNYTQDGSIYEYEPHIRLLNYLLPKIKF